MAQLTLRDLATNEEIVVPPEGFVFGRVGGDADIQIEDNSISRRQARVSQRQGTWVLEVMVVPPGQRLPRPQALQEGQTFLIGQSEFEVVVVEPDDEAEEPPPAQKPARNRTSPPAPAAARRPGNAAPAESQGPKKARPAPSPARGTEQEMAVDAPAQGGIAALFSGIPRGIAYYVVNVPLLLFNPLGTVKRTITELPSPAMGLTGLIGHALPALLVQQLIGSWAAGIVQLINGGGFNLLAFVPVVPAVVAVVSAVVVGLIFHPVTRFIINTLLKGESDERSRTNYFLQLMTLAVLLAVPNALGLIIALAPVPFIGLVGTVLLVAASLVGTYVNYQWLVAFKVYRWFQVVVLVVGVLLAVGTLATGVMAALSPAAVPGAMAGVDASSVEEARRQAEALAEKARADAEARLAAATAAAPEAGDEPGVADARKVPPAADSDGPRPAPTPAPAPPRRVEPPPPEVEPAPPAEPAAAATGGSYAEFARRRAAVERLLENDPTLLGDRLTSRLYGDFLEAAYRAETGYARDHQAEARKNPGKARLYELQKNAAVYRAASGQLRALADHLKVP